MQMDFLVFLFLFLFTTEPIRAFDILKDVVIL